MSTSQLSLTALVIHLCECVETHSSTHFAVLCAVALYTMFVLCGVCWGHCATETTVSIFSRPRHKLAVTGHDTICTLK
jgi:hypothetical protein